MPTHPHDFSNHVPPHVGPSILPNTPFLAQLLRHAQHPSRLAIRDANLDPLLECTYAELLVDAVKLREVLREKLPERAKRRLNVQSGFTRQRTASGDGEVNDETVMIGVLAPGGYEFVVAILAIWALGAAVVPMTTALPVEEALYFVRKSRQSAILTGSGASELGKAIVARLRRSSTTSSSSSSEVANEDFMDVSSIPITPTTHHTYHPTPTPTLASLTLSSTHHPSPSAPALIIFTSGTTGPPKGAVLPSRYISEASRTMADYYALTPQDKSLHLLPVHHITGLVINILPFLVTGACVEFRNQGGFDAGWVWERWRRGCLSGGRANESLTVFSGVPTIYVRLMRWWQARISKLPLREQKEYRDAVRGFRGMMCGTSALPRPVQQFWTEMSGKAVLTRYGATEVGVVIGVPWSGFGEGDEVPDGAVGMVIPGVELRLAGVDRDGDVGGDGEGEILVKSPHLFSHYLSAPAATASSFDDSGFFNTGDIAHRVTHRGKSYYHILGRASIDIIKSGGYKISALDIEREVLALSYIGEVVVVGVDDAEFGQRVGAIVTLREDQDQYALPSSGTIDGRAEERKKLTVEALRTDLRARLASYKMPTLLRVMPGELPKTASGKVLKKTLGPQVFPSPGWDKDERVMAWRPSKVRL